MGTSSDHWTCLSLFRQILPSRCIIYLTLFFLLLSLCNGDDAGETTDRYVLSSYSFKRLGMNVLQALFMYLFVFFLSGELPYWVCQAVDIDGRIFIPHPWTFLKIVLLYLLAVGLAAGGVIWCKKIKDAKNADKNNPIQSEKKSENKDAEKGKKSNKKKNKKKNKGKKSEEEANKAAANAKSTELEDDKAAENAKSTNSEEIKTVEDDTRSGNEGGGPPIPPENKEAEKADKKDPIVPSEKEAGRQPVPHSVERNFVKLGKLSIETESHATYDDGIKVFAGEYDDRFVSVKRILLQNAEGEELAVFIAFREKLIHYACESENILRLCGWESNVKHMYMCFEKWECTIGDLISFCSSELGEIRRESLPQEQICFLEEFKKKYKLWEEGTGYPTTLLISLIRDLIRGVAHMHDMGYIHGNLNPESVVIVSKGDTVSEKVDTATAKIADLRLSRHHSDKSMGKFVLFNPFNLESGSSRKHDPYRY